VGFSEFSKPPLTVQAEQVEEQRSVITPNGSTTAEPGDWEVRFPDGNVRAMSDEEFQEQFGEQGSEDSGNRPSAPAMDADRETGKDRESESASAVADNTKEDETEDDSGSPDATDVDSKTEQSEDRPGNEAEEKSETRDTSPPPIRRTTRAR
jgi:hypothetical protein